MLSKATKLFALLLMGVSSLGAQTATNWTVTDCKGSHHELFADLDAGKVVVLIWVMPCGSCIEEGLSAQSAVQNANAAHPGKVIYYLADDYGNSDCNLLEAWCAGNGITDAIVFTDKLVSMNPYGAAGMPKVVVFGGGSAHKVYYNQNGPYVTEPAISAGIDAAIAESTITGLGMISGDDVRTTVYPNPVGNASVLSISVNKSTELSVELMNSGGQLVKHLFSGKAEQGSREFLLSSTEYPSGIYLLKIGSEGKFSTQKIIISH